MNKVKLIALDMDGTLLNDDGIVTEYTKRVIDKALQKNIKVVLSTGRPLQMCSSYADELELTSYIITSNGAEIWTDKHQLLERHTMDSNKIQDLWELGNANEFHMWLVATDELFVNRRRPESFHDYKWLKIGYGNLDEQAKRLLLQKLEKDSRIEITNSSLTNLEINKAGVNKARAIETICRKTGISVNEVMAIGDSLNDLKMIKEAGVGVAVANAQQLIIESADYVTDTNNDDGVAKAIERFAL